MNKLTRIFLVGILLVFALAIPVAAQDQPGAGEGDPLIISNFGADINTMNAILAADGTSTAIIGRILPNFLGTDVDTGYWAPSQPQALVTDWAVSEDGLTYTFTLRDDMVWSDGVPVTSADVVYFWDTINNDEVNVSGSYTDLPNLIESVTAPDDYTVEVKFFNPDCNGIDSAGALQVVPAHHYQALFPDPVEMNNSPKNLGEIAEVSSGPWTFRNFRPGEQVTLLANPEYPDETVIPAGFIFKSVADQTIGAEQFLNGELTYLGVPQSRQQEIQDLVDAGEYLGFASSKSNMRFLGFNLGDPANPQPGLDDDGNLIDQGLHPIFGDVRVRQALNYAMNFEEINEGVFFGLGVQMATHSRPDNWAHPEDITPYPFDLDMANSLLEEAGWVDTDGDGVRECQGCLYATEVDPAFEGEELSFDLRTNAGNVSQEALGTILQDQWSVVGAVVDFQPIDFNTLVDEFVAQTYDAIMIFWGFGEPFDPDGTSVTFAVENDLPNSGFNTGSYYNERVQEILDTARALPGCDQEERKVLYQEMYEILKEESPWIWIGVSEVLYAAQPWVEGWDPKGQAVGNPVLWNEETWILAP